MKKFLLALWLIAGLVIVLWHFGPGQAWAARDTAAKAVHRALTYEQSGQPELSVEEYQAALASLPPEDTTARARTRIALAKALLNARGLPEARTDMESLLSELPPDSDPEILAATRTTLAETQYYNTWLMRLEGAPREEWEPEIESARQLLRNQAESSPPGPGRDRTLRNLETTIRLARLDLTDLQAMPIPSKCRGCKSCQGKSPGKKGEKPKATKEDVRSAGGAIDMDQSGD